MVKMFKIVGSLLQRNLADFLRSSFVLGACIGGILLLVTTCSIGQECASLEGGCDNGAWDPAQKLDEIGTAATDQLAPSAKWPEKSRIVRWNKSAYGFGDDMGIRSARVLVSMEEISKEDILLDVSQSSKGHIEGSIYIPYTNFTSGAGILKPPSEIARILGDAGISGDDSIIVYSECPSCGGGPSFATYAYWMMKLLGHERVRVLDGDASDWAAAGKPMSSKASIMPARDYVPGEGADAPATYQYVKGGQAQIVDARTPQEYESGSIPGSISIPYDSVLRDNRIKDASDLKEAFAGLSADKPVVVYTNTGVKASVVWFALEMMGYDARLYSWRDWLENEPKSNPEPGQPEFDFELADADVSPNPVRSGSTTTLTASFKERQTDTNSSSKGEVRLTVKGCATCGFDGFSLGTSGDSSGVVQLGASSKGARSNSQSRDGVKDGVLRCTAIIKDIDGSEAARTSLLRTAGSRYMGVWNADVAPGVYKVDIEASISGEDEVFKDALEINVTD